MTTKFSLNRQKQGVKTHFFSRYMRGTKLPILSGDKPPVQAKFGNTAWTQGLPHFCLILKNVSNYIPAIHVKLVKSPIFVRYDAGCKKRASVETPALKHIMNKSKQRFSEKKLFITPLSKLLSGLVRYLKKYCELFTIIIPSFRDTMSSSQEAPLASALSYPALTSYDCSVPAFTRL